MIISAVAGTLAVLSYVVKLSIDYSRLRTEVKQLSARQEEDRRMDSAKFAELFNSRNKTNEVLTELTTTVKMMVANFDGKFSNIERQNNSVESQLHNLERKIDRMSAREVS